MSVCKTLVGVEGGGAIEFDFFFLSLKNIITEIIITIVITKAIINAIIL